MIFFKKLRPYVKKIYDSSYYRFSQLKSRLRFILLPVIFFEDINVSLIFWLEKKKISFNWIQMYSLFFSFLLPIILFELDFNTSKLFFRFFFLLLICKTLFQNFRKKAFQRLAPKPIKLSINKKKEIFFFVCAWGMTFSAIALGPLGDLIMFFLILAVRFPSVNLFIYLLQQLLIGSTIFLFFSIYILTFLLSISSFANEIKLLFGNDFLKKTGYNSPNKAAKEAAVKAVLAATTVAVSGIILAGGDYVKQRIENKSALERAINNVQIQEEINLAEARSKKVNYQIEQADLDLQRQFYKNPAQRELEQFLEKEARLRHENNIREREEEQEKKYRENGKKRQW